MAVMTTLEIVMDIAPMVAKAIDDALAKHGPFTQDMLRAQAILTEEVGELAEAVLGVTKSPQYKSEDDVFGEAIHVAAVAFMFIIGISNGVPAPEDTIPMPENGSVN